MYKIKWRHISFTIHKNSFHYLIVYILATILGYFFGWIPDIRLISNAGYPQSFMIDHYIFVGLITFETVIGWFIKLSVQTFQPLIVINKRGNFDYH